MTFAPKLPDGRSWDDARETVADLMIDTVDAYAPGFKGSVIARQILSPLDLERTLPASSAATSFMAASASTSSIRRGRSWDTRTTAGRPIPGLVHVRRLDPSRRRRLRRARLHDAAREMLKEFRRRRWPR